MSFKPRGLTKILLTPPYLAFRTGMALKNSIYDSGIKKPVKIDARIISVGGLSFGGAGKSPMSACLAAEALKQTDSIGKTAVVSRGYSRSSKGFLVVSDGKKIQTGVQQAGDELFLIAKRVPGLVVIADENRIRGAQNAGERFGVKNIILDDCFQRRSIARDFNLVMLEPELAAGERGFMLREGLTALRRADAAVILDAKEKQKASIKQNLSQFNRLQIFFGRRKPVAFFTLKNDKPLKPNAIAGKKSAAFCGLANPQNFAATLQGIGLRVEKLLAFPDHSKYRERDLARVANFFTASGAEILLTTEKDAVKLPPVMFSLPIYYLTINLEIEGEEEFLKLVFGGANSK